MNNHTVPGASVAKMSEVLKVSRSGYYAWLTHTESKRTAKRGIILTKIKKIHEIRPKYGLDAIWNAVKKDIPCCRGTVHKLMQENDIRSERSAKWKATSNSAHHLPVAPNLLLRERSPKEREIPGTNKTKEQYERIFSFPRPNMAWVGDITYNWTDEGWLYTAIVKDLCSKDVVGYAMGDRIDRKLVIRAMEMAIRGSKNHPPG